MRHVATIIPSARSLFTPVNRALRGHPSTISLSASGEVRLELLNCDSWSQPLPQDPHMSGKFSPHMNPITLDIEIPVRLERAAYGSVIVSNYPT